MRHRVSSLRTTVKHFQMVFEKLSRRNILEDEKLSKLGEIRMTKKSEDIS